MQTQTDMSITIVKFDAPKRYGNWAVDFNYAVCGPGNERHEFTQEWQAIQYVDIRRKAPNAYTAAGRWNALQKVQRN